MKRLKRLKRFLIAWLKLLAVAACAFAFAGAVMGVCALLLHRFGTDVGVVAIAVFLVLLLTLVLAFAAIE